MLRVFSQGYFCEIIRRSYRSHQNDTSLIQFVVLKNVRTGCGALF